MTAGSPMTTADAGGADGLEATSLSPDVYGSAQRVLEHLGLVMLGCPMCGSANVAWSLRRRGTFSGYQCQCNACGLRQGSYLHNSVRSAIETWNRRAVPEGYVLMPTQLPAAWADQLPPTPKKGAERGAWLAAAWSRLVDLARPASNDAATE